MAKKEIKKEDKNYEKWKEKHGIKDETAYKNMRKVRDAYERSRSYLQSSCFHDSFQDGTGTLLNGGSWYERWNLQKKMALMWFLPSSSDDFSSNIKSAMSRGRINTFVNWAKKLNLSIGATPNTDEDRNAAKVADKVINYWYNDTNAKQALDDAWEDLATHGNAYIRVSYVKETKQYRFAKTKDLTDEEDKKFKEGEKIIYSKKEKTITQDDVVFEYVPLQEIYPDPSARNLHGDSYRAGWIIRKRYVTLEYLRSTFENNPMVKHLDEVKGSASYKDDTEYFFQPPRDTMGENLVELLEMEDADNDCYYVVANDIAIIGGDEEVPMPYRHKELTYHKLDFIRVPGQYFSIGICDLLMNLQGAYEIGLNMIAEYIYRTYNYKLVVESENIGEIEQSLSRMNDMLIPIDTSDGRSLGSKIMPLQVSPLGFDIFNFLQLLETNATLATNIDPAQMALLAGSKTATSDMMNRELLMTMIGGVIQNNTNGDLKSSFRQVWKLMQQFYSVPRAKDINGEGEPIKYRTITLNGSKLDLNIDKKLLEEKETGDYSQFEIKEEYLSTKKDLTIYIKPESTELQSQATDEKRMSEEFAQLMPFAVDPNNVQQVMNHQMPMIDAVKLFHKYFSVKRLPENLLINKNKSNEKAIKEAEEHVMTILEGGSVRAIPGQSSAHLEYEYAVLDALELQHEKLGEKIKIDIEERQQKIIEQAKDFLPFNPATGEQLPLPMAKPDPRLVKEIEDIEKKLIKLQEHLLIESMPASMRNSRIMAKKQEMQEKQEAMSPNIPMPAGSQALPITEEMISGTNPGEQVPMINEPMSGVEANLLNAQT